MKTVIIELDDAYADILTLTVIGHGEGYTQNVNTTAFKLQEGRNHFVMEREDNNVTRPHWRRL